MNKIFYIFAILPLLYVPLTVFGGYYSCSPGFSTNFDNSVFNKTDIIPIKIWSNCGETGKNATVIVSDGGSIDKQNKFLEQNVTVNQNPTEVDFEPPNNTVVDRFMITILDQNGATNQRQMVFTNEAASHILISDVTLPQRVKVGYPIPIAVNITDGLGRPIPQLSATAVILYPSCDGWDLTPTSASMQRNSSEYVTTIGAGNDMVSGTFPLRISVVKPSGYYPLYWQPTWTGKITIEPNTKLTSENATLQNVDRLFHHVYDSSSMDAIYSNRVHGPGDDITISGQTATDGCGQPIPNVNITGKFIGMPTPLIKAHTTSDNNGNFQIHFQTYPQLTLGKGYDIELTAKYNGKEYSWRTNDQVILWDIKHFTFNVENKTSMANVLVDYGYQVNSLTLDKKSKTLLFEGEATNSQGTFFISIPHDLIGGDFIVEKDGKQVTVMSSESDSARGGKTWMYGTGDGYTVVQYTPGQAEKVNLKIIGTTVIPEFPFAATILWISVMSSIVFYRIKFRTN